MISRSTLIGALVVVELALVGAAIRSFSCNLTPRPAGALGWDGGGKAGPAATRLDRRLATGPAPHVVVDVKDVRVVIVAGADPVVRVVEQVKRLGWVSGDVPRIAVEQTGDGVRVSSPADSGLHVMVGGLEHVVRLTVPAGARVEVSGDDGAVEASGLRARFTARTGDGSIHVRNQRGDLDVRSGDGAIALTDVQAAEVTARTADGRLTLSRVAAERLTAGTADGRIEARDVRLAEGAITTKDGRVHVAYTPDSDAVLTARTRDGRIDLPAGLSESGPASAGDDGDVVRHERVVRLGEGRGRFEISSSDGSITISQGAQV
jgi:putative adhesin